MKYLVLCLALFSTASFAGYDILCFQQGRAPMDTYSDEVQDAFNNPSGTTIILKDGTVISYSVAVDCKIIKK